MFPIDSETKKEGGLLRSGRRSQSGKRRRSATRRGSCSATERRDYKLTHLNGESCDEEEEYQIISEEEE